MNEIIFVSRVRTSEDKKLVHRLIQSIRTFGGELSSAPFWVFTVNSTTLPCCEDLETVNSTTLPCCEDLENEVTRILPLDVPDRLLQYAFGDKVFACAKAEEMAPGETHTFIWADPTCLVVSPPDLYVLRDEADAAVRPVHIRNVGLSISEPLDAFWKAVVQVVGITDIEISVESFVDQQKIRAYYNTHAFSINPHKGLMHRWLAIFEKLVCDGAFQAGACADNLHRVFLHQAVLSALIAANFKPDRIRLLPSQYNYPYHLHTSLSPDRRARAFNDLVSFTYEDRNLTPASIDGIEIHEPLLVWLANNIDASTG